jgi:hypothetical protein
MVIDAVALITIDRDFPYKAQKVDPGAHITATRHLQVPDERGSKRKKTQYARKSYA